MFMNVIKMPWKLQLYTKVKIKFVQLFMHLCKCADYVHCNVRNIIVTVNYIISFGVKHSTVFSIGTGR